MWIFGFALLNYLKKKNNINKIILLQSSQLVLQSSQPVQTEPIVTSSQACFVPDTTFMYLYKTTLFVSPFCDKLESSLDLIHSIETFTMIQY